MNIALYNLTTTVKLGGVESIVWDVGQKLAERGHRVTIFGGRGAVRREPPGVTVRRYPYVARDSWGRVPPLRKSLNLLKLLERLSMAGWALGDLMRGGFDIVQVVKPYDFPIGAHVRFYRGARLVYNSHGTDFFPGDVLFRRSIDGAFACSRFNARMVEAHYKIPIDVSYNGFDADLFRPATPDAVLRARYAPDGAPLILYAGRLVTFKGLDFLLDALARLPGARLILAGDGPHRASLEAQARRLGIAERAHFIGNRPHTELPQLHAISDVFAIPSTDHETFCLAACEAMSCERPVVAARTGGLTEVVRDGETGLVVPPADAPALARALGTLLDDPALRARMGRAGREWTHAMFTWDVVIGRMLACYERVLGRAWP
ncbi:glycosyltransferase family 4 protein [Kouleothrix sp.]|uniref:glycosyltransferase family 4 protein n=1 Tax=Kouleothrix sp. TaxID=2779161 RepID=UPI00391BDE85